jgi:hypothetical protein
MRRVVRFIACAALAILAAGCTALEGQYFRKGIGTELAWTDVATATELQNIYLDHLCRQASPFVGAEAPGCVSEAIPPTRWPLIVQAGMNDIDLRCDAYLAWLDQKKRENAAILAEIGTIRFAVDALINPAISPGVGPRTLAAVTAAFGLATGTLTNVNALLLQVDHTTVQSVVFINRQSFRESVLKLAIDNKPMAIHALRSYLTICMPMTISANINATVTVYQQAGPGAIDRFPLVSTSTIRPHVAVGLVKSIPPEGPRGPLPGVAGQPGGPAPEQKMIGGNTDVERQLGKPAGMTIQSNLCVTATGEFDGNTREAIRQAKVAANMSRVQKNSPQIFRVVTNEIKTFDEVQMFLDARHCSKDSSGLDRGYATAFEKFFFADEIAIKDLQVTLANLKCDPNVKPTGIFDAATRSAITNVKAKADATTKKGFTSLDTNRLDQKSYEWVNGFCV